MIYQVKGMCGVCMGVSRCVRVCTVWVDVGGMCGCVWVRVCTDVCGGCFCEQVCMGVLWYTQVCRGGPGCVWKCSGVWVCMGMGGRVWDEFSEYLLETRVLTSADFNMYPIQIFSKFLYFY